MRDIKIIILHCSDTFEGTLESIRKFHMAPPPEGRGWNDIAYHWLITTDGMIHVGRTPDVVGAHCEGHNENSLGICLVGKNGRFTLKQFLSLRKLLDSLRGIYGIGLPGIFCHYEFDKHGKTCPDISKEDLIKFLTLT